MNAHVPALRRSLKETVAEYDEKAKAIPQALADFEAAGTTLKTAATIAGVWGDGRIDTGRVGDRELYDNLLKSAWKHVYDGLSIDRIASAKDKARFKQAMEKPAPFTLDNIVATFEGFVLDPRGNILRGLAEVFCDLDQAYKSHDKVKIGVAGLPKRVIVRVSDYDSYSRDRLTNILNALAAYQNKPLVTFREVTALLADENALLVDGELPANRTWDKPEPVVARGVRLRRFQNGNGHLFFEPDTLRDVNKALAEFYGEVLPDTTDERPAKPAQSTAVSKDLQYYPTPVEVFDRIMGDLYNVKGERVLEPSCGCGRLMDGLRKAGAAVFGIEVDPMRAAQARAKGHAVLTANFLETVPPASDKLFDRVVMNPPFYGKHLRQARSACVEVLEAGRHADRNLAGDGAGTWACGRPVVGPAGGIVQRERHEHQHRGADLLGTEIGKNPLAQWPAFCHMRFTVDASRLCRTRS